MPRKDIEQKTSYPTDVSELTGLDDLTGHDDGHPSSSKPSILGRLVRLVSGASAEEHDKGRELRRAVRALDLEEVRDMIRKGYGVNEAQEASLACIAARRAHLDMLRLLVEAGVDVNKPDRRSQTSKARTPLQEASRKGWMEGVKLLLDLGADVDACEEGDITALHIAARLGHTDVVHMLLKHRADPCGDRNSTTSPLHETASPAIMNMLLQAGASINQRDRNKCTPLHLQTYSGRPDLVDILLKAGADVNACDRKGRPAVFLLGGRGDTLKTYDVFKSHPSGINYKMRDLNENGLGHSLAQRASSFALIEKVFRDCVDVWVGKNLSGQTPSEILSMRGQSDWALRLQDLIDRNRGAFSHDVGDELDMMLGRRSHR